VQDDLVDRTGVEIMMSCAECTAVVVACMRWAMNFCPAGEMAWSSRLIRSQLGMVAQAGGPDGSVNAVLANGRWAAACSMASWVETSPAKTSRKSAVLM